MRGSELDGKEVIEVTTGERLGVIKMSELLINTAAGKVDALLIREQGRMGKNERMIPWRQIRKISRELILVEGVEVKATKQA